MKKQSFQAVLPGVCSFILSTLYPLFDSIIGDDVRVSVCKLACTILLHNYQATTEAGYTISLLSLLLILLQRRYWHDVTAVQQSLSSVCVCIT